MEATKIIKTFANAEYGIEATIAPYYKGGFSVAVKDTDANEYLPFAKVFLTMDAAIACAEKAVA
jgi:hypothetical protein